MRPLRSTVSDGVAPVAEDRIFVESAERAVADYAVDRENSFEDDDFGDGDDATDTESGETAFPVKRRSPLWRLAQAFAWCAGLAVVTFFAAVPIVLFVTQGPPATPARDSAGTEGRSAAMGEATNDAITPSVPPPSNRSSTPGARDDAGGGRSAAGALSPVAAGSGAGPDGPAAIELSGVSQSLNSRDASIAVNHPELFAGPAPSGGMASAPATLAEHPFAPEAGGVSIAREADAPDLAAMGVSRPATLAALPSSRIPALSPASAEARRDSTESASEVSPSTAAAAETPAATLLSGAAAKPSAGAATLRSAPVALARPLTRLGTASLAPPILAAATGAPEVRAAPLLFAVLAPQRSGASASEAVARLVAARLGKISPPIPTPVVMQASLQSVATGLPASAPAAPRAAELVSASQPAESGGAGADAPARAAGVAAEIAGAAARAIQPSTIQPEISAPETALGGRSEPVSARVGASLAARVTGSAGGSVVASPVARFFAALPKATAERSMLRAPATRSMPARAERSLAARPVPSTATLAPSRIPATGLQNLEARRVPDGRPVVRLPAVEEAGDPVEIEVAPTAVQPPPTAEDAVPADVAPARLPRPRPTDVGALLPATEPEPQQQPSEQHEAAAADPAPAPPPEPEQPPAQAQARFPTPAPVVGPAPAVAATPEARPDIEPAPSLPAVLLPTRPPS